VALFMESSKTDLGFRKLAQIGFPKQLIGEHKRNGLTTYQGLLNRYRNEGDAFLRPIDTGDESWINNYTPESRQQCMERKHPICARANLGYYHEIIRESVVGIAAGYGLDDRGIRFRVPGGT
jgi:hypothetical protein